MAKKNKKRPRKRKRLTADPKRQANDSLRGYRYQILHSVNAWLNLADDEILRLEGVEDFDIVSNNAATLVQVKDTRRNVTLKSKAAIEAINHYWESRTEHPDLTVKFRFLTRSKIGKEQGNPFGSNQQGLRLWSRCSRDEEIITKISEFLRSQKEISDEVRSFLEQASLQQIYEQLIEPITWETNSPDADSVEKDISDKLGNHGNKLGLLPSDVSEVLNALLNKAFAIATQAENRELTKGLFFEIFEAGTTQRVPTQHLRHLQRQATQAVALDTASTAPIGDSPDITIQLKSPIQTVIPPLYPNVAPRTDLLTNIQTKLQSDNIVVIQGGVDKGKTTLVKLIANDIGGSWFWLNLRERDPAQVTQLLQQLDIEIDNHPSQINVILDDLNLQSQHLRVYEEILGIVVYSLQASGAKLLITSQHKPPNNFIRSLGLSSSIIIDRLDFTVLEIEQFAKKMACPTDDVETWVNLIQAHTGGHPRLVHALLTQLREEEWKQHDIIESILQTPSEVLKERESARQLLMSLPEDRREFLYRLSLLTKFRKDYALNIGEIPESIFHPGDVFSQLVGPWIDQVDETYYTVSSLLTDAAKEVWSESKRKDLHAHIADAIRQTNDLTTAEAWAMLLHSIRGENRKGLIAVISGLITASQDDWEVVSKEFSFLIPMKIDLPERLFIGDTFVKYLIRFLQYRITAKVNPEFAPKILEVWDKETKTQQQGQEYRLLRRMLVMEALRYNHVLLPAKQMVDYLKEVIEITNSDEEFQEIRGNFIEQIEDPKADKSSIFSILFSFVYTRPPVYAPFLNDLIDALDELDAKSRGLLLANFTGDSVESRILIDAVWLAEANRENPDWTRCLEVFDKVIEKTIEWGYSHIAAASAKGKAIIHDEKLNDPDTAHQILQDISLKIGTLPLVAEEQALVYLHQKRYKDALNIYERLLPEWNPPSEQLGIGPLEEYRRAAICAAHLDDWEKAATFLEEGAKKTQKIENTERHIGLYADAGFAHFNERYIGLYADAGFAHFKAGNMLESIKLLNLALQKFETIPQDNTDLEYFTLKKRLAGSIGWIAHHEDENYTSESKEPSVGFCSNPETNEEVLNLPDYPIGYAWSALAKIEYEFGHGTAVLDHAWQVIDWDTDLTSAGSLFFLKIRHDFKSKTFDELPRRIQELSHVCDSTKKHIQSGEGIKENEIASISVATIPDFTSVESITVMLVASLLVQLPTGVNIHENLAIWRENSSELPVKENLTTALNLIESTLSGNENNALSVMKAQGAKYEDRLAAALKIVHNIETSPENLFHAHTLITTCLVNNLTWLDPVTRDLAELLSVQWLEKIKFRATLKTPMITVPQIEQACNSSEMGKKKIGQILLAVHQAVSIRVAPETLQQLRSWAESKSEQKQETTTVKNPIAQRLITAMEKPPHLTDEDVEALNQSIKEGKIPVKFDSPFESDEREKE